jgi:hypothetical protein
MAAIQTHSQNYPTHATPPPGTTKSSRARLIREYERAIYILNQGTRDSWTTPGQYLAAFDKTNKWGIPDEVVTPERAWVRGELETLLPPAPLDHKIWDEHLPYVIQVQEKTLPAFRTKLSVLKSEYELAPQRPAN